MGRAGGLYGQSRWSVWTETMVCMDGDDGLYDWRCCPGSQQKPTGSWRNSITVYTAGKEDASSNFAETANFLHKITSASQLRVDQRWQLIIYWAFRKYKLIYRLYPPLLGDQIMLPLA